jgi:Protein of unknown function (DUF2510)
MSQTAGWFPDPYGRFQQRYFNGSQWTEHVVDNGRQAVDPLGATVSVPFAAPAVGPTQVSGFLDRLGPDARARPRVQLTIAIAGVGGFAVAIGIVAAIVGDSESSRVKNTTAAAIIVAIAYAIRLGVKTQPELRSAAVGAGILGIPGLAGAITDGGDGGGSLTLAAVLLVAAWILPGMRGRPLMLGAGAVAFVLALTTVSEPSTDTELFDLGAADVIGGQSWLFVLAGIAFLAMVWWLDARGYQGVGTSLVAAAILATALAVVKVVQDLGSTGAALLLVVAGLAVSAVGDHGQRRASTWFGVGVAAIGVVSFFFSALTPSSVGDVATTLIMSGVLLTVAPGVFKVVRASRTRSSES